MRALLFLLLLAVIKGTQACVGYGEPTPAFYHPSCQCGVQGPTNRRLGQFRPDDSNSKGTRIVGGSDAGRHEFPWIIRLMRRINATHTGLCGGSLLSDRTILTAAHCVSEDSNPDNYRAFIMDYSRNTNDGEIEHSVHKVEYHHKYDKDFLDYDYGIITLQHAVDFNANVYPICLPDDDSYDQGWIWNVVAAGWGLTNPNSATSLSDNLQKVTMKVVDSDECRCTGLYCWFANFFIGLTSRQLCLKRTSTTQKQCTGKGDSGGPAMTQTVTLNRVHYYNQIGITSGGDPECTWDIDAKVSAELDWIKHRITGLQCRKPPSW